jgi:ribose-phosphate pyrophosphokinase
MAPSRVVTVDLHCGQIQGFFHSTPVDNLFAENEMLHHLKSKKFPKEKLVIVSPDAGGVLRANRIADKVGARGIVTILKRRLKAGSVDSMQLVGDVSDTITVIVDDMIDTGGTLCKAAALLKDNGAQKVYAVATHGLFSGPAMQRINDSCLEEVCVTDSIPQKKNLAVCSKLTVITIAPLLAEAIRRLHIEKSLSNLFDPSKSKGEAPQVQSAIPQLNL